MEQINLLSAMILNLKYIEQRLESSDAVEVVSAMRDYRILVDKFYSEFQDFMAPQQYEGATKNLEYFTLLLESALAYCKKKPN